MQLYADYACYHSILGQKTLLFPLNAAYVTNDFLRQHCRYWHHFTAKYKLRLPHRNDDKIAKICNLWTFWPVIQPISNLFKIWQKALSGFWKDGLLAELPNFAILASFLWGNLKHIACHSYVCDVWNYQEKLTHWCIERHYLVFFSDSINCILLLW